MRQWLILVCIFTAVAFLAGCGGGDQLPEKLKVSFKPDEKNGGDAKGTVVIDTKTGTDVSFEISGLEPGKVYTAFFVNIKSQMFLGIGQEPFTLPLDANGSVNFTAHIEKDSYKRYTTLAIYLNPGGKPIHNPVGVKATLNAVMKQEKPVMVLSAKLR